MGDVFAAEWLKLRSVRATGVALAAALAFMLLGVLLAWLAVRTYDALPAEGRRTFGLADLAALVAWSSGLCLGVLGVLAGSGEYRSGTIRTTFLAVPGRVRVLVAKAAVVGAVALAVGQAVTLTSFLATRVIIGDRPIPDHRTAVVAELPELALRGCMGAVYALLGLALAVLLRSTAAGIVGVVLPWYILPIFFQMLPGSWGGRATSLMPEALPEQVVGGDNANSVYGAALPPWLAAGLLLAYAIVPPAAAALPLTRRDA